MTSPSIVYSGILLLCAASGLILGAYIILRKWAKVALPFLSLCGIIIFYSLGSFFEIRSLSVQDLFNSLRFEYLGIAFIGPVWFLAALTSTGKSTKIPTPMKQILFVIPLITLGMVMSNESHHLYYVSVNQTFRDGFSVAILKAGPFYVLHFIYLNLMAVAGSIILIKHAAKTISNFRMQSLMMFSAVAVSWIFMTTYTLGLSPWGLDTTPIGIFAGTIFFFLALFRYQLLDLSPLVGEQVLLGMNEGVLVMDQLNRLIGFNPAMVKIIPLLNPSLLGLDQSLLTTAVPDLQALIQTVSQNCSEWTKSTNDEEFHFQVATSPLKDAHNRVIGNFFILTDITTRVNLTRRLQTVARTDELTGAHNRRYFLERASAELDRNRRYPSTLSLTIFDLDLFKKVNDTWGHEAGDEALKHVMTLCLSCLRTTDVLARYGGEEFAVVLTQTDLAGASIVCERMRNQLAETPFAYQDQWIIQTASFGLAQAKEGETLQDLIRRADEALYKAKATGRNRVVIHT